MQLADFKAETIEPAESDWAELREAQTMTMDALKGTGQAVIIDLGEGKDIHPKNKQDVGKRLALWALADAYGKDITPSGPLYRSHRVEDGKIRVSFEHAKNGLMIGKKEGSSERKTKTRARPNELFLTRSTVAD